MKKLLLYSISLLFYSHIFSQSDVILKPIENIFNVVWMDTIQLKGGESEPIINGNLIIPPYGNDGCYIAETGEKLFYTFSPHYELIKQNMATRYILYKTKSSNIIFDILTGKNVYYSLYRESDDDTRYPYINQNRVVESRYVCFSNSLKSFICIDTNTMKEKWKFQSDYEIYDSYIENNNIIYFGSSRYLYAIDVISGKLKWKTDIGNLISNIVLDNGIIYLFIEAKGLTAVDIKKGEIKYVTDRIGLFLNTKKILCEGSNIYFVDNKIHSVDKNNGTYTFTTSNYKPCSNTESFFIYKDNIFSQSCDMNNYSLEGFDINSGEKTYKISKNISNKNIELFLKQATYFSPVYNNMVFSTSMMDIKDGFWYAVLFGVKINSDE